MYKVSNGIYTSEYDEIFEDKETAKKYIEILKTNENLNFIITEWKH